MMLVQWDDAPSHYALIVSNVTPEGIKRKALAFRHMLGLEPAKIGLQASMDEAGEHLIKVSVAEVNPCTNELGELLRVFLSYSAERKLLKQV
jgi:hypothetical protein